VRVVVVVFALCATCCVVGHVAILHSIIGRRSATVEPGVPRPKVFAEIIWALIPALALALVLTATWGRVRDHETPKPGVMMKVAQ
jgi:heme/copper-type cytochrome/quinol oxidase subunit 2